MIKFLEKFESSVRSIVILFIGGVLSAIKANDTWSIPFIISAIVAIVIEVCEYSFYTEHIENKQMEE